MPVVKKKMRAIASPLLHISGWMIFYLSPFLTFPLSIEIKGDRAVMHTILTISLAIVFYLNFYWLIPKYLKVRKYLIYFFLAIFFCFLFSLAGDYLIGEFTRRPPDTEPSILSGPPVDKKRGPDPWRGVSFFATITILSIGIKMTLEWAKSEQTKKELENEKLRVELMALKAQINPHFFFNVMNSLCSLARKKSDDTEKYIIKLSDIFRYNLNDLSQDKVRLSKELEFIHNYIDIQHMRIPSLQPVVFDVKGNADLVMIEPMLLFPFIENAFKHGASGNQPLAVHIGLEIIDKRIHFRIENSFPTHRNTANSNESTGIGQQNARRRLDILYPGKHNLLLTTHNNKYIVDLNLDLS